MYPYIKPHIPYKNSSTENLADVKYKMDLHRYEGKENERLGLKSYSFILGYKLYDPSS